MVTLLCDSGERYLSSYYDDGWVAARGIDLTPYLSALSAYEDSGTLPPV